MELVFEYRDLFYVVGQLELVAQTSTQIHSMNNVDTMNFPELKDNESFFCDSSDMRLEL